MADIKDLGAIATKWARVTPGRTADYEEGVRNPRADWAQKTSAASDAYKEGVTKAVAAGSFKKGVDRVGTAKWQQGALTKGPARWGQGVQLGESAYQQGFGPYHQAIASTTLPPRFARRDPRNLDRVRAIVTALVKTKENLG